MDIHKSKRHLCGGGASTAAGVEMRWVGLLLLLCAAIPLSAQPDILYYKFNETSGALARNSAVPGQGYDSAILSAAPIWNTTNPRLGTACVNNTGQQRRMSSGYSMSERNGQNFTIEFWFRTSAGGYQDFCNDGDAFAIWLNNGRLQVYINGQVRLQSSATNLNNNTWRYAALTRSGNTFRLYWGSTSGGLSSSNTNYTTNFSTRALELLHWQGVVPATYEGEMDEFRLWSVARTAGQLNSGRGAEMSTGDMEVFDSANDFIKHQGTARYTRVNAAGFTDYTFSILNTRNGGDITFNPVTLPSVTGATASVITQPATISPGATTNFTVRVTPTQPEFYVSVDINSDRAPNPYQITIHGMVDTGRPEMLYFRLNEGSGTQTANDASPGRGANPAIFSTGPSWNSVSPRLGNAAAGSNANLPTGFTGTDLPRADFTVEFWMRTSTTTGTRTIVGDGQSFRIYLQNGALRVLGGVQVLSPGGTVNDNNWHHVALVSNPGTYGMRLYINGALQSETINFSFPFSNTEWTLFSHNGTDNFVGELDEFRVWAYARDAAEIAADLNWELFGHLDVQRPAATSIPHAGADNVGNAPVGVPLNLNYTLANTGGRLLTMGTPALTVGSLVNCTASVLSDPVGAAVAASGSVVGQLQVTPTASGPFSFVLTAASDDIDRPAYLVNVSGTGISGEIDVQRPVGNSIASGAPDALGGTFVGIAAPYTYTIANLGAGTLNIGAISALSLVNCGVAITPPGVTALGAGVSTTFQVDITAAAPGAFSFTLSIVNDDLDENPYDILVSGSAVNPPQLSAASPVSYGSSNVGVPTATVGHVISNAGGADLTITSISFVGTNPGDWSLLAPPTPPVVISAGGNLPLQGIFTPSATGARSAQLRLVSDSGAVPGTVTLIDLTGNGTEGVLGVPGSGTYGSSNVGVPSSSVPHTLTNTGSGPIEITGITPTGDWALAAPVVLPAVVGVGGSLNFSGIFTPTATGLRNGSFQIGWNQGGGVAATLTDFNVSGTGTFGLLGVNTPVNHGSSNVGVSTASFPHALNNTGTGPIQITAITLSGTNPGDWAFSPLPALPAVVNWGGNLNISTIFTPQATGARSALINVTWNQGVGSTITPITLDGNGTLAGIGVTSPVNYGSSNVGVSAPGQNHVVNNTGTGPMTVTAISVGGDWTVTNLPALPLMVAAGGNFNFDGLFTPTATGGRNATIQVSWNQGGGAGATITDINVSGNGIQASIGVTSPVNYGSSNVGVPAPSQNHVVNNTGIGPMTVTAISVGGDWTVTNLPALPLMVAAGGNFNFDGIFTPTATGGRNATIQISWDQGGGAGATITDINVSGNGIQASIGVTSPVNYGSSNVGVPTAPVTHTINNTGTGPMNITGITPAGDWAVSGSPALPVVVPAGMSYQFDGIFTPAATGARTGSFDVAWDQGGGVNPQVTPIAVDGTGTFGDVSVPAIYDHGGVLVGSSSPRTHRIDSVGTGPIRILGVSMAGADAAYWSLSNLPAAGQPLASGAWWDFDAPFTPDAPRLFTAQIIVTWDQGAGSLAQQAVIDVSGTGGLASSVTGVSVGPDDGGPVRVQADVNGPATYLVDVAVTYTGGSNPGTAVVSSAPGYTVAGNVIQDVPVGTTLVFYWDAYATEGHTTAADYVITLSPSISGFPGTPGSSAMFALTRQGGWTKFAAVADTPGTVSEHAMIRDVANDRLIAFGGIRSGVLSNETWAFDNASATWRRFTPSGTPPSPRREVLSVYDAARNRMIVFGGQSASGYTNDTFALYLTPGSEYWSQIAATSPATPSPRTHGTLIVDEANDRAILCGGYTSPKVHLDIWALSLAAGTESWGSGPLTTTNSPRTQSIGNASIYDPIGQRMLVYRAFTAELYELSLDVNLAWTNLTPAGTPSARRYPAVAYDSLRHAMILQGGLVGTATLTETWSLDIAGMTWSQLPDEPDSGGRFWHTGSYDETRDRFVMLGGRDGARVQNETQAVLDLAVPAWLPSPAAKSDAAGPEGRIGAVMCNDPMSNRVLLFGGQTLSGMANDVWMLDRNAPGPWTRLSTTGPTPAPRAFAAACYDAVNQRMIMFGGQGGSGRLDDLWTLDLAGTPSWTLWSSGVGPSARSYSAAAYRPGANRLMVFGGQGATQLNDYWEFNFLSSSWIQPTTSGTPPAARIAHGAVFDSAHNRFVVFCGTAGAAEVRDVWALDVSIPTPVWTDISATGTVPNPRARFAMAATPSGNSVYVHGGKQSYHQRGDTWRLDLSGPLAVWTLLADFTGAPTVRLEHAGCLDNAGRFVIGTGKYLNRLCSDVWELDITLPSPAWAQLAVPTTPPNLAFAQSAYDPVGNRMIVFSGVVNGAHTSGLWQLDLSVSPPAWSLLSAAGVPPSPRSGASFVYDGAHTPPRMLMYGGNAGTSAAVYLAELWALELTPGAEQWVQLSPSGAFTWRGCHSAVIDGSGGMVVFGGTDRYGKPSAIIQRMDLATLVWSNLATTGTAPAARNWHGAVYDGSGGRNRMLVYGGQGSGYFSDLWELNLTTLAWTQLASSGATPAASMSVVHDAAGERMLIFGGNNPTTVGDFLSYDLAGDTWTQISPTGSVPQARWGHAAIWDSVKNRLVVAGGLAGKAGSYLGEIPLTQNAGTEPDTWFWGD